MRAFVLHPGDADSARALADAGAIPRWDGAPLGRAVLRGDVAAALPGDHVLGEVDALGTLPDGVQGWARCRTPGEVDKAVQRGLGAWLEGTSTERANTGEVVLLRAVPVGHPFVLVGAGPRAMAATLALGASGVVLDRASPAAWAQLRQDLQARARTIRAVQAARVVQGPMANVAEGPGLVQAVHDAGALPFLALGALRPDDAARVLNGALALGVPFGVGIIGFDVMPHRDAHLALLQETPPEAVILAGGSPALAVRLQEQGLTPWLHTPSATLTRQALARGVRAVVLEGREAGGHVGRHSALRLWEDGLDAVAAHQQDNDPAVTVVLAGAIGDATSAAFALAMAADVQAAGGTVCLQAGTAFLLTHEARASGQVTAAYQDLSLAASRTVVVGSSTGLELRCVPNAFTEETLAHEQEWERAQLPRLERRERLETRNLGRTRMAARGIERNPDPEGPRYREVPAERLAREAALTVGEGVSVQQALTSCAEVVEALGSAAVARLRPRARSRWGAPSLVAGTPSAVRRSEPQSGMLRRPGEAAVEAAPRAQDGPVAIVGLGCVLPGAPDRHAFWRLLSEGGSGIGPIPPERWDPAYYYDPTGERPETTRSMMAGVVAGDPFEPLAFRIPPAVAEAMDRAQRLALVAAAECIGQVRLDGLDRTRCAVLLGNAMGGENSKDMTLRVRFAEVLRTLGIEETSRVRDALSQVLPPMNADTMAGLLGNVIAGRIASWLDWQGGNLTVDAACASGLAALDMAVAQLRSGAVDLVLTGGVDTDLSVPTYIGFSLAGALSTGASRPFSALADGFVMGEGAVVLALKRLDDAERDGDRIWAVLRGVGRSSDGRGVGITAPLPLGQRLAIQRAWRDARAEPAEAAFFEAHGTGTQLGDRTELSVLAELTGEAPRVGSVKSQLGHLKSAAGAAGLAKACLALAHGVLPPTVNAWPLRDEADAVQVVDHVQPLDDDALAGVSAFGFGGTNFHAVLQAPPRERAAVPRQVLTGLTPRPVRTSWVLEAYGADDRDALVEAVRHGDTTTAQLAASAPWRAVVVRGLEDTADNPQLAAAIATGRAHPRLFVGNGAPVPVVALFPGQGAQKPNDWASAARHPVALVALEGLGVDRSEPPDPATARLHARLFPLGVAWARVLEQAEVPVAACLGHSLGEYAATVAAGRVTASALAPVVELRGAVLSEPDDTAMVSVSTDEATARELARAHGLEVVVHNAPDTHVLGGDRAQAQALARNIPGARLLHVSRAFHHSTLAPRTPELEAALSALPWQDGLPLMSNASGGWTSDPVRALAQGLATPVRFGDCVRTALQAGHTAFVECGPGRVLCNLVQRQRPDAAVIPLDPNPEDEGEGFVLASAALLALGHERLASARVVAPRVGRVLEASAPAPVQTRQPPIERAPEADAPLPVRVRAAAVAALVKATGYDAATLTAEDVDLEAELGIDSIRKLEVLGELEEAFGFVTPEADYAQLSGITLEGLVAHVLARIDDAPAAVAEVPTAHAWLHVHPLAPVLRGPPLVVARRALRFTQQALEQAQQGEPLDTLHPASAALARSLAAEQGERPPLAPSLAVVPTVALPERAIWVVTGGLDGIVGPILRALLPAGVLAIGRRDASAHAATLEGFEALGIDVRYVSADLTDADAVGRALALGRERFGRLDAVLHGAGLLRDRLVPDLSAADVEAVFGAKVLGASHLMEHTRDDGLQLWAAISSVVARAGNAGQTLYAAANATLESFRHPTAARSVVVASTAWSGVGMARDLAQHLGRRGMTLLSPEEGGQRFVEALGVDAPVVTLAHADDASWATVRQLGPERTELVLHLDPGDPVLEHHQVHGRPLVPAAWWVQCLEQALELSGRDRGRLEDFRVLAPTFVNEVRSDVVLTCDGETLEIRASGTLVATARARSAPLPTAQAEPVVTPHAAAPLYRPDALFHGPTWRVLDAVGGNGNGLASAWLHTGAQPVGAVVDGLYQLLAAWSGRSSGFTGLPVGARSLHLAPLPADARVSLVLHAELTDDGAIADAVGHTDDGRCVLTARGVTLKRAGPWPADAPDLFGGDRE